MKVLLVDNQSVHLPLLHNLIHEKLGDVEFMVHDPRDMTDEHMPDADLVVFSGGTGRSIEKNPQTFERMVSLAVKYKKPTIGICLGAEAIAVHFGSRLREMPGRRVGNVRSHFSDSAAKSFGLSETSTMVYEFHKWLIEDVYPPLESLATSKDGVELFRHTDLPIWGMQFHPEVRRLNNQGHTIFEYILRDFGLPVRPA